MAGTEKKEDSTSTTATPGEPNFAQVRKRERRNLIRKITSTIKSLKNAVEVSGSKTYIRMQSEQLQAWGRSCQEVNDDLCEGDTPR